MLFDQDNTRPGDQIPTHIWIFVNWWFLILFLLSHTQKIHSSNSLIPRLLSKLGHHFLLSMPAHQTIHVVALSVQNLTMDMDSVGFLCCISICCIQCEHLNMFSVWTLCCLEDFFGGLFCRLIHVRSYLDAEWLCLARFSKQQPQFDTSKQHIQESITVFVQKPFSNLTCL